MIEPEYLSQVLIGQMSSEQMSSSHLEMVSYLCLHVEFWLYVHLDAIYPDIVGDNLDIVFIGFPIATTSTFITGL